MADAVLCLFTFLLIIYGGLTGDADPIEKFTHSSSTGQGQALMENSEFNPMAWMQRQLRYKCYQCETPKCEVGLLEVCHNAVSCFKASTRDSNGTLRQLRGCNSHDNSPFSCRTRGARSNLISALNLTCCIDDLCNAGAFPQLKPLIAPLEVNNSTNENDVKIGH